MLVLSRTVDEAIVIPKYGIRILIVEIRGGKCRIGIDAADDVDIYREEIAARYMRDGKEPGIHE